MNAVLSAFKWFFARLPLAFSLPFGLISLWWVFFGFRLLNDTWVKPGEAMLAGLVESHLPGATGSPLGASLGEFFQAVVVIVLFLAGLLIAYNAAALVNWIIVILKLKPVPYPDGPPQVPQPATATGSASGDSSGDPLAHVNRIGLVLAGGGAKGAHQAGAMKAIYRFLAQHNALHK